MDTLEEIEKHWGVSPKNPFKVDDSSKALTLCFKNLGVKATQSCGHTTTSSCSERMTASS